MMPADTEKKVSFSKFLDEVKVELKKVRWPSKEELTDHTVTVIALVVATGVFIFAVDTVVVTITGKLLGM